MLTGLFPPTSGDAIVADMLLTEGIQSIRDIMGVCPQDNRLWEELTVYDHMQVRHVCYDMKAVIGYVTCGALDLCRHQGRAGP